jgi:hypothetical protein
LGVDGLEWPHSFCRMRLKVSALLLFCGRQGQVRLRCVEFARETSKNACER